MSDIILENKKLRLILNENSFVKSLINKSCGEELIPIGYNCPFFSATQDRPFNNEIKLAYMNKKTTFMSSSARLEAGKLIVKFGLYPFEAQIGVDIKDEYMVFTLEKFIADKKDYPQPMDFPPVTELSLVRLPVDKKNIYGQWMNICHTDTSSVAVMSTSPHTFIDSEMQENVRVLTATAKKGIKLLGCSAALIVSDKENLLDAVDSLEADFGLPRGVESRKSDLINASVYWTSRLSPDNVDTHIANAKLGGFKLMLMYYTAMTEYKSDRGNDGYVKCGSYAYNENYPNGEDDMRLVLEKIKAAGIKPGFHFLHTHIGIESEYVTPKADRRLHLTRRFTLSKPISKKDTTIYVDENPIDCPICAEKSRLLRFDGEIISYESYSEEYPYCFTGCKRGIFETEITEHTAYTVGGVLDISEFGGTSIYLNQESDLQDEIAGKIKKIYDLGFEFIYFDGSEGTNAPFEYHVPNAQYRIYKRLNKAPIFCEGAAKAHFGWHMLSGGNAFDVFPTNIFKAMIIEHPFKEAALMKNDLTRVNFGWWAYRKDTRVDVYEFGTSKAASYDCPATTMIDINEKGISIEINPRYKDIFEMMKRWEEVRSRKLLTEKDKEMLRDPGTEFTLLKKKNGEYLILPYYEAPVADPNSADAVIGRPKVIGEEPKNISGVRAFVFEHNRNAVAVVWDDIGSSTLTLKTDKVISYTRELDTEDICYKASNRVSVFPVSDRAYIRTSCSLKELADLLKTAEVTR